MPKFNFRLQGYLELKSKMEDQRKQEYGQAVSELERERGKLAGLESRRAETVSAFRADLYGGVNPGTAAAYNNFLEWLKKNINMQVGRVRRAEAEAERRRAALAEAMKERKMLETLKDKDYAEFIFEQNLAEQKAADEIVSFRRGRNLNPQA